MIPIILNKEHSLQELVTRNTGGIGELPEAFDSDAVERANGLKEASFKIPVTATHYKDIVKGSYIKIKDGEEHDPQIYEVYQMTKPMNGIVTVKMQHISYILSKATVLPFTASGITSVIQGMRSHLVGDFPFTMDSTLENQTSKFTLSIPRSFRGTIAGWEGSILDIFGGELDWDNLNVHLLKNRGSDNGVRIEYGKNLVDIEQEESIADVYDAVIGYAVVDDVTTCGTIQKITTTTSPRTLNVDFSDKFGTDNPPTVAKLNTLAMNYAISNNVGRPHINLTVEFAPLWKTAEYEDISQLERVGLFDTVHIYFERLGVDADAKVIETHYDFIRERPISIELGDAKPNLTGMIEGQVAQATSEQRKAVGMMDSAIANLSTIILNSLGLFYTKVEKSGGGYQFYLHNKPQLNQSQYQWTINAGGFAVSQDYGLTWSAGIDLNGNAVFNSIAANVINAMEINGGKISAPMLFFNVNESPAVLGSGKYTMYDFADSETKTVYGPFIRDVNDGYATGLILRGGFALASTLYPAYIGTENNHRLLLWFGSTKRKIDNRTPEQSESSTAGLYIANETAEDKCYIALRDDGILQEVSQVAINVLVGTNGINIDKTKVNIHGTSVTINGVNVITCGSNNITCQTATDTSGHTILNFFLNGSYVGHTVY